MKAGSITLKTLDKKGSIVRPTPAGEPARVIQEKAFYANEIIKAIAEMREDSAKIIREAHQGFGEENRLLRELIDKVSEINAENMKVMARMAQREEVEFKIERDKNNLITSVVAKTRRDT